MSRESLGYSKDLFKVGTLAAGAVLFGGVAALEVAATRRQERHKDTRADIVSHPRDGDFATYVISGYHTDGRAVERTLDRHFSELGSTHYTVYPEKGFALGSLKAKILESRRADNYKPAKILAISMGGLVTSKMFSDPEFLAEFGPIDRLVLDSALSGKKDLRASEKAAMAFGAVLPVTYSTNKLYLGLSSKSHTEIDHEDAVRPDEVYDQLAAKYKIPFSAGHHQINFMRANDVEQMNLAPLARRVHNGIVYMASTGDDVVNTERSSQTYVNALGLDIEYWVDSNRKLNTLHAGAYERPHSAIDALTDSNRDSYRICTLGAAAAEQVVVGARPGFGWRRNWAVA